MTNSYSHSQSRKNGQRPSTIVIDGPVAAREGGGVGVSPTSNSSPGRQRRPSTIAIDGPVAAREGGGVGVSLTSNSSPGRQRQPSTIAIDGPVASGKSTLGDLLARRLGYLYFDTGVMYRAVAWAALDRGLDPEDDEAMTRLAQSVRIDVIPPTVDDGRQYTVYADGVDVTWAIRRPEVDLAVSPVSANPGVRAALTPQQRRIALAAGGVVMAGRDIGTVVLPDADLKIYLDAAPEERARRRHLEILGRGQEADYEEVLASLRRRDAYDSGREAAPLRPAEDAVVIDTTRMGIEQVLDALMALIENWSAEKETGEEVTGRCGEGEARRSNKVLPVSLSPRLSVSEGRKDMSNWRPILQPVLRFLIWLLLRVETEGMERMPRQGPLILMFNHIHLIDPVVLVAIVPRYAVAMGKVEIMSWPIIGPLVYRYPTIPVRRGELDMAAVRQSLAVLQGSQALIIAPEGTRSRTGRMQRAKHGMVFLAQEIDPWIQPVAVTGTTAFPAALKRLRRVPVRYRFGRPFRFRWPEGRPKREVMQQMTDEAMYELARLLPPEMRGVYSDLDAATTEWLRFEE